LGQGVYKPSDDAGEEGWSKFSEKVIELSNGRLIPRPDLEDEVQRDALYKALGKPGEAKEYEFDTNDDLVPLDDGHAQRMREVAFRANLTKEQLKLIDMDLRKTAKSDLDKAMADMDKANRDLRQEWGMTYDDRVHQAKKVAQTFFPHLDADTPFSADEIRSFFSLAKQLNGNGAEFSRQNQQGQISITPDDAALKIAEIRANKEHPYHDTQSPGHQAARRKMRELYLIKNGLPIEQ
ncbi:MAG: hypothetical protein ACWGQW_04115, partial [bacterium]